MGGALPAHDNMHAEHWLAAAISEPHGHTDRNTEPHADADGYADSSADAQPDSNGRAHAIADCYSHSHADGNAGGADAHSNADCSCPDAAATVGAPPRAARIGERVT